MGDPTAGPAETADPLLTALAEQGDQETLTWLETVAAAEKVDTVELVRAAVTEFLESHPGPE